MSIFKINGLLIEAGEGITQPVGQSSARWQVLGRAHEPKTVAMMARDIGHARQSVQRIADVLAEEGLVAFKPNSEDRRAQLVALTPEGAAVLHAIYLRQVEWSLRIMSELSPAHLLEIAGGLDEVSKIVAESFKTAEECA